MRSSTGAVALAPYRPSAFPPFRLPAFPPFRLSAFPPSRLSAFPPSRLSPFPPSRLPALPPLLKLLPRPPHRVRHRISLRIGVPILASGRRRGDPVDPADEVA